MKAGPFDLDKAPVPAAGDAFSTPVVRAALPGLVADMTADAELNARVMSRVADLFAAVRIRLCEAVDRGEAHPDVDPGSATRRIHPETCKIRRVSAFLCSSAVRWIGDLGEKLIHQPTVGAVLSLEPLGDLDAEGVANHVGAGIAQHDVGGINSVESSTDLAPVLPRHSRTNPCRDGMGQLCQIPRFAGRHAWLVDKTATVDTPVACLAGSMSDVPV